MFYRQDENFAIADLAGFGGTHDHGHGLLHHIVGEDDFDFYLGEKINGVFAATINLRMPLLTSEAFHLGHGHSFDPKLGQSLLHFLEFERLDNGFELFH